MEKKAKIIATLGPAIHSENKLKAIVNAGVDAFRINFSHNISGISKIVTRIRKIEKILKKRIAVIADLQGVKLRIGKIDADEISIKHNQKFIFDSNKKIGNQNRVCFPYPIILKKLKPGNKILIDDGKFVFKVVKKIKNGVVTTCLSQNCKIRSNKSIHLQNFYMPFNNLTQKDKNDIKTAKKLGCNWIALSYIQNAKLIGEARKLINKDMGIICKIENKTALKNINEIINASDAIMIARGDLAIDVGHSDVPQIQLDLIKKCSKLSKPVIVATQMLESMIENATPTRAEINDIATAIFQGADVVMLSAETAIGKYPIETVRVMAKTVISTEKYKKQHIQDFKNKVDVKEDPRKSIVLSVKDLAYNPMVKA
ncbi:MAG: pyruvate kinase, partial [Pelagibacteraceae bacterium]